MIGIVDVEVQAANPQMPLCPFVAFVGSPSSVRVRNVPGNIGRWDITKVYVSANYPDNSIQSRECTRVGEIYVGTLPACDTVGKGANGFAISADGVDESGNAVTGYVLGKGDLEILDADGAITPGVTTHYVHGLDEQPSDPHEYDIYKDGDTWKIYFNGAWGPLAPAPVTLDDTVTPSSENGVKSSGIWSAIWGALSALPTGFSSLYDWCVAQFTGKFAQYYPDGSVKSTTEFTQGIKYNAPDTVNRTITVKPFCKTRTAENDNSGLVGRVVIPPFVDASGNPYITDDGTRYKVMGVSSGSASDENGNATAIIAPNTVTSVGDGAFDTCTALASVSLPAATDIGAGALSYCISLTSVSLPAATDIGMNSLDGCDALTSVSLPAATDIGINSFVGCAALTSIDFGETPRLSVPSLGHNAFFNVPTTCKIIVPYTQYDAWIAASGWSSLPQEFVRHAEKADKPATFTTGNLAKFDSNGNPVDSGKKPSDFQSALSAQQLANIAAVSDALAFDATHSYAAGDPVVYNGTLYTFTTTHTGAWTGSDVSEVDIIATLAGKLDKSGGTITGDLEVDYTAFGFTMKDASGNYLRIHHGTVAGNFWYVDYSVNNVGSGSLRLPYNDIIPADIYSLAGWFDESTTYALNSLCTDLQGVLWRCINPNGHTGAWVAADFAVATVEDVLAALRTAIEGKANRAANPTTGNLAALDADGNPTDAGWTAGDLARYALTTKTISNNAVTLDDRAINAVAVSSSLASLTVNFPTATSGKARDFGLRLTVASGITTAPQIVLPQGVTCENADGEAPEIGADGATTILYFTETDSGVFLVKGEVVTAIS